MVIKSCFLLNNGLLIKAKVWLFLVVSAMLLNLALMMPDFFFAVSFIFLIPIFYLVQGNSRLGFVHGFFWGILFFLVHFVEFFLLVYQQASGTFRPVFPLLLVIYCALYAGLWFKLAYSCEYRLPQFRSLWWIVSTAFYFFFMTEFLFWIFGSLSGYCFINPLVPLAIHPFLLGMLANVTFLPLFTCIVISSWLLAKYGIKGRSADGVLGMLMLAPFIGGYWVPKSHQKTIDAKLIAYAVCDEMDNPLECAQNITKNIQKALEEKPSAIMIIMPESTFPFCLNNYPEFIEMWSLNALDNEQELLIGSHSAEQDSFLNSFFVVRDSRIMHRYVKNTYMFFTEYIPPLWNLFPFFKTLFLRNKKEFTPNNKKDDRLFLLAGGYTFEPCICSDLFLTRKKFNSPYPLLCIASDNRFQCKYFKRLMALFARYAALEMDKEIIYVTQSTAILINRKGNIVRL